MPWLVPFLSPPGKEGKKVQDPIAGNRLQDPWCAKITPQGRRKGGSHHSCHNQPRKTEQGIILQEPERFLDKISTIIRSAADNDLRQIDQKPNPNSGKRAAWKTAARIGKIAAHIEPGVNAGHGRKIYSKDDPETIRPSCCRTGRIKCIVRGQIVHEPFRGKL